MAGEASRANGHKGGRPKGALGPTTRAKQKAVRAAVRRGELTAARVLEEMRRLAFVDPRGFWTSAGALRAIHNLTAEQAAALAGFEAVIKNASAGDGHTDTVHKIKILDKTKSLEMLAKYFGLLTERVTHDGVLEIKISKPW